MELQYTMTEKDLRNQFLALGRTRGSLAYRQMRAERWVMLAVLLIAEGMYAASLVARAPVVAGVRLVDSATVLGLAILAVLLVPLLVLVWLAAPRRFAARSMRQLRAALPAMTSQPHTLRLEDGTLHYSGPGAAGGHGQIDCAAARLRAVRADKAGLVIVLEDGSGLLAPRSTFAAPQDLAAWVQALQTAAAAPGTDVSRPAEAPADGFTPDGAGGGVLAYTLTAGEIRPLLWEAQRAVWRTAAYWRRNWYALPLLALAFAIFWRAMGLWMALALLAVLLALVVLLLCALLRGQINRRAGRFVTRFGPDAMICTDGTGRRLELPYHDFPLLLITRRAILLYAPKSGALRLCPRRVLMPESEAALLALLRDRLNKTA